MTRRGLFLDLDGTIADSLGTLKQVYHDFLIRHGCQGSEAEFEDMNGPPISDVVSALKARHVLPGSAEDLLAQYVDMMTDAHASSPPTPFAAQLLNAARERGWFVTVVTSATRASAEAWLRQNGLLANVDAVVGGDEVSQGKPSPEPYLLAIHRSGCEPSSSLAVEDSRSGVAAALAAGLTTCAIVSAEQRSEWPIGTRFVDSLADVIELIS